MLTVYGGQAGELGRPRAIGQPIAQYSRYSIRIRGSGHHRTSGEIFVAPLENRELQDQSGKSSTINKVWNLWIS
jgi:hypothetical protein